MRNRSCLAKVDVELGEGCTGYCHTVCHRSLQPVETSRARQMHKIRTEQCVV